MRTFRTSFKKLLPSWLSIDQGELLWWSLGVVMDGFLQRAYLGTRARFPTYTPEDALSYMSRDRKIVRGIGETADNFAIRLIRWLDDHRTRGNPYALMEQLAAYCQASVRIRTVDRRGNVFTRARDGTPSKTTVTPADPGWEWDGIAKSPQWARFWVIIYPESDGGTPPTYTPWDNKVPFDGSWLFDGTHMYGTTATPGEVATVQQIINDWKPAGAHCEWIIIAYDDASFDPALATEPDGTWYLWGTGTNRAPNRNTTAVYWQGPGILGVTPYGAMIP
jgi:hypothetical protein